jgi:competence protein ComEA
LAALSGGRIIAGESQHTRLESLLNLPDPAALTLAETPDDPPFDSVESVPHVQPPVVVWRTSIRPVVVAVAATALVAWIVLRVTVGGPPSTVEVVPGTPLPVASGVLVTSPSGAAPGSPTGALPSPAPAVVVQVLGQVRRPGLVTLSQGSRVADALVAAGGLTRGGSSGGLNLARQVVDGEQIIVSPDVVAAPSGGGATSVGAVVDLNAATLSDLDALPGVGPVMAGRIVDWRTAHGRFTAIDQLREISGIGARTFQRLAPHVRV